MQTLDMDIFTKIPYPGLRSFHTDENHLFFGRERQLDELLRKLRSNRFLAVVGTAGSGKSSLVRAALTPKLEEGFTGQAGSQWRVALCRPGNGPMANLSKELSRSGVLHSDDMMDPNYPSVIEGMLRRGSLGIVEAFKQSDISRGENLMIVIDQFEELFRFAQKSPKNLEEAANFINLILNASRQKESPIYVMLTMRSGFIGSCTDFRGLPEAINDGQFLIPRMKTDEIKKAIIGPVRAMDADIEPELVNRITNDLGEEFDELGTLQHLLMRMWDQWLDAEGGDTSAKIDVKHYEAVGTFTGALSKHAEEIYLEMDSPEKKMRCERMFRALLERGSDGKATRRPQSIRELMNVLDVKNLADIRPIIYAFSQSGRLFLSAPEIADMDEESTVSIAHESLIHRWSRLSSWAEEEFLAEEQYLRLCSSATLFYEGKGSLLRDPELTLSLKWYNPAKYDAEHSERLEPTTVWAERYNTMFFEAIEYLKESEKERDRGMAMLKADQDNRMKRARGIVIGSILFALLCVLLLAFAIAAGEKARRSAKLAYKNEQEAKKQTYLAERSKEEAARRAFEARQQAALAREEKAKAEQATQIAMKSDELARRQAAAARDAGNRAIAKAREAMREKERADSALIIADNRRVEAEEATERAIQSKKEALRIKGLSLSQSVAVKSSKLETEEKVKGLLAKEAFELNRVNDGKPYDAYIYEAVYKAVDMLEEKSNNPEFNTLNQPPEGATRIGAIRAMEVRSAADPKNPGKNVIYSTGSDGWLLKWDMDAVNAKRADKFKDKELRPQALQRNANDRVYRAMGITEDGKYLVRAGDDRDVELFDLKKGILADKIRSVHNGQAIYSLAMLRSGGFYSVGNDRKIRFTGISSKASTIVIDNVQSTVTMLALAVTDRKRILAGVGGSSDIYVWDIIGDNIIEKTISDIKSSSRATAVAISPNGRLLIVGYQDGTTLIWDLEEYDADPKGYSPERLKSHTARISSIAFNKNGSRMVIGSYDNTATIWVMRDMKFFGYGGAAEYPYRDAKFEPIRLTNHKDWVMSVAFTPAGDKVLTGTADGMIKIWETEASKYADRICEFIANNLSNKNWKKYIGTDGKDDRNLYILTPDGRREPILTCDGKQQAEDN